MSKKKLLYLIPVASFLLVAGVSLLLANSGHFKILADALHMSADTTPQASDLTLFKTQTLDQSKVIKSLTLNVSGNFSTENDVARVILKTKDSSYLVYEDSGIFGDTNFSQANVGTETKYLANVYPVELEIYKTPGAAVNISNLNMQTQSSVSPAEVTNITALAQNQEKQNEQTNIKKLNQNIAKKGEQWVAGETSISQLNHQQLLAMFNNNESELDANTMQLVYYKSGVFNFNNDSSTVSAQGTGGSGGNVYYTAPSSQDAAKLPTTFTWRSENGQNWVTPVKNQGNFGTCWDFSAIATLEASLNVWYNRPINADLSEQWPVWVEGPNSYDGSAPQNVFIYAASANNKQAIPPEANYPYNGTVKNNTPPSNPLVLPNNVSGVKIKSYIENQSNISNQYGLDYVADFEISLIQHGPMSIDYMDWNHAMLLVGFNNTNSGTVWEIKNSWGKNWGMNGYLYAAISTSSLASNGYIINPYYVNKPNPSISCVDTAGNSYYSWGIGPKPNTCPANSPAQEACDDANTGPGYRNSNGKCIAVKPNVQVNLTSSNTFTQNGENIILKANPTITGGGSIAKVQFYDGFSDGSNLLGTVSTAPYTFTWQLPQPGPHQIVTKVFSNNGKIADSNVININVIYLPWGSIQSLVATDWGRLKVGTAIPLQINYGAYDLNDNQNVNDVAKVALELNGKIIKVFNPPYTLNQTKQPIFNWTPTTPGIYNFSAMVTDVRGVTNNESSSITDFCVYKNSISECDNFNK
jgi:C1A family cysteine protease